MIHPAEAPRTEFATPSDFFKAPLMPLGVEYALWPLFNANVKPLAVNSLAMLARHIHRQRNGFGLQLTDEPGTFRDGRRDMVRVDALDVSGERHRLIGYAYLRGGPRSTLEAAIRSEEGWAS